LDDFQLSLLTSLSASAITGEQLYVPYGTTRSTVGALGTAKAFTGQEADPLTGLSYYHARWYDPVTGLFVSVDPQEGNAQGVNPYAYVRENPETATDPTGERAAGCIPGRQGCDPDETTGTYQCTHTCEAPPTNSGSGDGGNGGCTWKGKPCSSTNNPCGTGTVWNGSGCVSKSDHTGAENDARKHKLLPKLFEGAGLVVLGGLILALILCSQKRV
jgi:RHS repeat-associated protein